MGKYQDQYQELLDKLKTERDELELRMHLAKAELRDEWAQAEQQWDRFRSKSEQLARVADESGEEIWEATKLLSEEVAKGYRKLRDNLRS
jgi:hypothetical protein